MDLTVYLSGEIHTDWRQQIKHGAESYRLPVVFTSAVTDHAASDAAGDVLGAERNNFWRDHKSSKVNRIRTKTLIDKSDIAVVRFGDKYKQWNAAFDAGYCAALGKPYITFARRRDYSSAKGGGCLGHGLGSDAGASRRDSEVCHQRSVKMTL